MSTGQTLGVYAALYRTRSTWQSAGELEAAGAAPEAPRCLDADVVMRPPSALDKRKTTSPHGLLVCAHCPPEATGVGAAVDVMLMLLHHHEP